MKIRIGWDSTSEVPDYLAFQKSCTHHKKCGKLFKFVWNFSLGWFFILKLLIKCFFLSNSLVLTVRILWLKKGPQLDGKPITNLNNSPIFFVRVPQNASEFLDARGNWIILSISYIWSLSIKSQLKKKPGGIWHFFWPSGKLQCMLKYT